jgi:hypothetical protein
MAPDFDVSVRPVPGQRRIRGLEGNLERIPAVGQLQRNFQAILAPKSSLHLDLARGSLTSDFSEM